MYAWVKLGMKQTLQVELEVSNGGPCEGVIKQILHLWKMIISRGLAETSWAFDSIACMSILYSHLRELTSIINSIAHFICSYVYNRLLQWIVWLGINCMTPTWINSVIVSTLRHKQIYSPFQPVILQVGVISLEM